jgi:hypothetical protein
MGNPMPVATLTPARVDFIPQSGTLDFTSEEFAHGMKKEQTVSVANSFRENRLDYQRMQAVQISTFQ